MYLDTHSWDGALKSVLRQDPNIVMIGEMRDMDTIMAALQIAETGHLVFTTLHTNSASQSVERIITTFPEDRRSEIRQQFASVLEVVISERLVVSAGKGMVPAIEIMLASDAVRNLIREGKPQLIDNLISTGINIGMTSLDRSLANLVLNGDIEMEDALRVSNRPEELRRLTKETKK